MKSIALLSFSVALWLASPLLAQQPAQQPQLNALQTAFSRVQERLRPVAEALSAMEQNLDGAKTPLWAEAFRPDAQPFAPLLREVFVSTRRSPDWGNQPLTMLDVMQWSRALSQRAATVVQLAAGGLPAAQEQEQAPQPQAPQVPQPRPVMPPAAVFGGNGTTQPISMQQPGPQEPQEYQTLPYQSPQPQGPQPLQSPQPQGPQPLQQPQPLQPGQPQGQPQQQQPAAATVAEWQGALLSLHQAYVRTIISSYVYLEMVKRAYLCANGNALLGQEQRRERQQILDGARRLHEAVQSLMELFYAMRSAEQLRDVMPYRERTVTMADGQETTIAAWEIRYAANYFFRRPINFQQVTYQPRPLTQFFAPFPLRAANAPADAPPPPANPPDGAGPGRWEYQNGEWQWRNGAQAAPRVEPPIIANNPELQRLIRSLEARLETDEVRNNAALRNTILGILQQLRPNADGPLAPRPPADDVPPAPMPPPVPPGRIV